MKVSVSFTPRPLYPRGKIPLYQLVRRLGGPQSRSGRGGEEKKSINGPNPGRSSHSLVFVVTELPWFRCMIFEDIYECFMLKIKVYA
jgi:hypothetical protein